MHQCNDPFCYVTGTPNINDSKRQIIWAVSHFDTITVFMKNHVIDIPQTENVPVSYDGGMSTIITPDNQATISVNGQNYPVNLTQQGSKIAR